MIFLVLSGKVIFLFPENMILTPDGKWKMIFLKKKKKNTQTYDDFFKCPEKMSSQKCKRWDMIFLRLSAKVAFAPP